MLLAALRSAEIAAENGFATGSSNQDAVRAGDLPHVAVRIGERAGVGIWALRLREVIVHRDGAPRLVFGFEDDVAASILCTTHQLVDLGIGGQPDHDQALMGTPGRSSPTTDHPAEADGRNQHHTQTDADFELQWLGKAIVTRLTHCHEPEGGVEGV